MIEYISTEVITKKETGVLPQPAQTICSFSDFAALYKRDSEFSGPDVIHQLFDLIRQDKVEVDFSVPGVRIAFK